MFHRLLRATMVLALNDNHQAAVTIPAGTIVEIAGAAEDDRFVILRVGGEQFHAFASDLSLSTADKIARA